MSKNKNIAIILDDNVPGKFKNKLRNLLKNYKILFLSFMLVKEISL